MTVIGILIDSTVTNDSTVNTRFLFVGTSVHTQQCFATCGICKPEEAPFTIEGDAQMTPIPGT